MRWREPRGGRCVLPIKVITPYRGQDFPAGPGGTGPQRAPCCTRAVLSAGSPQQVTVWLQLAGAVIAVGIARTLRGPGGGRRGTEAAQGTLGTEWFPGPGGVPPAPQEPPS